jgi:hypothetical protein
MVFLIQWSQNKDAQAIHLKLNEIVAALAGASNPPDQRRGPDRGRGAYAPPALRAAGGDRQA